MNEHEQRDVSVRKVLKVAIAGGILLIAIALVLLLLQKIFAPPPPVRSVVIVPETSPGYSTEFEWGKARIEKKKKDEAILRSYGWVNRRAGIVRVPIERAMRDLAKKKKWELSP